MSNVEKEESGLVTLVRMHKDKDFVRDYARKVMAAKGLSAVIAGHGLACLLRAEGLIDTDKWAEVMGVETTSIPSTTANARKVLAEIGIHLPEGQRGKQVERIDRDELAALIGEDEDEAADEAAGEEGDDEGEPEGE